MIHFVFLLTISNNVLSNQVILATHFNLFLGLILSCNLKWMPYERVGKFHIYKSAKIHLNIHEGLHPGIYNDRKLGQAHLKMGQPNFK